VKLTIAQFTFGLQLAGQERVVVDLAKAFHKAGQSSLVCTTLFGGDLVQELEASGITFKCLGLKKSYDPRSLLPVIRYLKDNRVDVVITHGNSGSSIPRIAAIFSRMPVFIHVEHNISDHKKSFHIMFNKLTSIFTDKIVCVSENARESLRRVEKTAADKILVIHNGINTDRFTNIDKKNERHDSIMRVGIVGRFAEQKGHIYFIEAAVKIVESYKDVEFIFVGDGHLRQMIENKVSECGLDGYCKFLGVRSDVDQLLQTFDMFILSSLWEGLPISLLEAQYFGVPAVVTDVGGIGEVIVDGINGLLVPPRDPQAMANAILKLLYDSDLRKELGRSGQEVFFSKFTVDKMAHAYLELMDKIFQSKKR